MGGRYSEDTIASKWILLGAEFMWIHPIYTLILVEATPKSGCRAEVKNNIHYKKVKEIKR